MGPNQQNLAAMEKRRWEAETGAPGDHDVPFRFALPTEMPQVIAWIRLLGRVNRGEVAYVVPQHAQIAVNGLANITGRQT